MIRSKKQVIMLCTTLITVIGVIIGVVLYDRSLRAPEEDKNVANTVFFDFDTNDVSAVYLQNGATGMARVYDTAEDLAAILPRLSAIEYDTVKAVAETQGWSYRVRIYLKSKDGAAYDNIVTSDCIYGGAAKLPKTQYVYLLTDESKTVMEEILALMPPR